MNSYVGMTMILKEQGQDDYFSITSQHKSSESVALM